jgi:hypothetical protein
MDPAAQKQVIQDEVHLFTRDEMGELVLRDLGGANADRLVDPAAPGPEGTGHHNASGRDRESNGNGTGRREDTPSGRVRLLPSDVSFARRDPARHGFTLYSTGASLILR